MARPIQMYITILVLFMVLLLAYMCMFHPYEDQLAVNYSVSIFEKNDKECESDGFDLEEYLERRRKCLLKYCGEVCNTTETDSGKFIILYLKPTNYITHKVLDTIYQIPSTNFYFRCLAESY